MTIEELNSICINSFVDHLGIRFTDYQDKKISGVIHLTEKHLQPFGVVHGGVYISFAETLAGAGSSLLLENQEKVALGMTVNSQHIASVKEGALFGTGILIHESDSKHIWDVTITDHTAKLISLSRVTNSIKDLKPEE